MKTFWSLSIKLSCILVLMACSPTSTETVEPASVPALDEQAFKTQFDQNFQQSCFTGIQSQFEAEQISANEDDLQAAQEVCACISYNLIQNNTVEQLQSLEQMSASAAQETTQPLVNSCQEQIQLQSESASSPHAARTSHEN